MVSAEYCGKLQVTGVLVQQSTAWDNCFIWYIYGMLVLYWKLHFCLIFRKWRLYVVLWYPDFMWFLFLAWVFQEIFCSFHLSAYLNVSLENQVWCNFCLNSVFYYVLLSCTQINCLTRICIAQHEWSHLLSALITLCSGHSSVFSFCVILTIVIPEITSSIFPIFVSILFSIFYTGAKMPTDFLLPQTCY